MLEYFLNLLKDHIYIYIYIYWPQYIYIYMKGRERYEKVEIDRWIYIELDMTILIYISKIKSPTLVEGDPKAPFSIVTTPRNRRGCYSIPWIAPPCSWSLPYNAECEGKRHHVPFFESLVWLDLGLNHGLPNHWRTLYLLHTQTQTEAYIYIYI